MALGNKEVMSKNIKKYLDIHGMSRKDLSKRLNVGYTTVSDWINAITYPRIDKIEQMANMWNIQKSDLVEEKQYSSNSKNSDVIAAHIDDDVTDEEMDEILNFIEFVKNKRK